MDDYKVRLPEFHGPLDLLLHLVKRNEVDIRDIPVAVIAAQFRQYLDVLQVIDIEAAGEFLCVAAMLLEIKSRMVLSGPQEQQSTEATEDPRRELVRQLIEYKRYRDAAMQLESHALGRQRQLARSDTEPAESAEQRGVQTPELWDLVSAFSRIIQEAAALEPEHMVTDETPQRAYIEQVQSAFQGRERICFREVFSAPPYYRLRLIGLFLAVLELIKDQRIAMECGETADDIMLRMVSSEGRAEHLPEQLEVGSIG